MREQLAEVLNLASLAIGTAGIAVLFYGAVKSLVNVVRLEGRSFRGENICSRREYLRHHLGSYLLLGLEFLVAADIVNTILEPDFKSLAILAGVVGIRTVISFFLNRELHESHHQCERGV